MQSTVRNLPHHRASLFGRQVTVCGLPFRQILGLICLLGCLLSNRLWAQTPWQASPTTPATLQPDEKTTVRTGAVVGKRSMTNPSEVKPDSASPKVISLPPPPGVQPPAHVSVNSRTLIGSSAGSLVPDSYEISAPASATPVGVGQTKAAALPTRSFAGLALPAAPTFPSSGAGQLPTNQPPANLPAYPLADVALPPAANTVAQGPAASLVGQQGFPGFQPSPTPESGARAAGPVFAMPPASPSGGMQTNSPTAEPAHGFVSPLSKASDPKGSLVGFSREPGVAPSQNSLDNELFDAGKLIAVVGADHILAGDMGVFVEPIIEKNRDRIPSKSDEDRLRMQLTRQVLQQYVEVKALYQEFFRDMVGTAPPKEVEDMKKQIVTRASKIFYEKQVPNLLTKYDAISLADLEIKLRENSMSLDTLRTQFIEQVLSGELERKYVPNEFEITRDELLKYYQEHRSDFEVQSRARWRQLTIRFDRHDNDQQVVETLIKNLGNQIYLGGKPFEAVARQSSEGYTAEEGGVYDWTTQGSLKSGKLDQAIFALEPNKLSQVIEDDIGMHIIEVLEREDGHTKDFTLAQKEIRQKLSDERRKTEAEKFRSKILARTPVWTLWPEDLKGKVKHVRPLSDALGSDLR